MLDTVRNTHKYRCRSYHVSAYDRLLREREARVWAPAFLVPKLSEAESLAEVRRIAYHLAQANLWAKSIAEFGADGLERPAGLCLDTNRRIWYNK